MKKRKNRGTPVWETDREFVLATSARLFREQGFDRTTVKQIAEACGMYPGSLHYRYASKESLLVDLMRFAIDKVSHEVLQATAEVSDPIEKMRRAINAHLKLLVSGSDEVYVLLFEWRSLHTKEREEMIALRDRYETLWDSMLKHLVSEGVIRSDIDINLLRLIGLGAINWVATWFKKSGPYSLEDVGNFLWQLILDAVVVKNSSA